MTSGLKRTLAELLIYTEKEGICKLTPSIIRRIKVINHGLSLSCRRRPLDHLAVSGNRICRFLRLEDLPVQSIVLIIMRVAHYLEDIEGLGIIANKDDFFGCVLMKLE